MSPILGSGASSRNELWVDALGELAEVDGTEVCWDSAEVAPRLMSLGDQSVVALPGGVAAIGGTVLSAGWRSAHPRRRRAARGAWQRMHLCAFPPGWPWALPAGCRWRGWIGAPEPATGGESLLGMIEEFSEIAAKHGRPVWSDTFRKEADALRTASTSSEIREIYEGLIQSFSGGSGSLTDLVLHRNGKPLKKESGHFDCLLRGILDAVHRGLADLDDHEG